MTNDSPLKAHFRYLGNEDFYLSPLCAALTEYLRRDNL